MKPYLLLSTAFLASAGMLAQDDCASAMAVSPGLTTMEGFSGNDAPSFPCYNGQDEYAWYVYTPTEDVSVVLSTDVDGNFGIDTRVSIVTGSCGATSCFVNDDDSGSGNTSVVVWNAMANTPYYIVFDNAYDDVPFAFNIIIGEPMEEEVAFTPVGYTSSGFTQAVLDMNADHLDDIVAVDGDVLTINFQQADGTFVMEEFNTGPVEYDPGWSICGGDLDNNGYNDLAYAGSGTSFIWANADGTGYSETHQVIDIFCQRSNMVDLNADGDLDVFVCHDVEPTVRFVNNGDNTFEYFQGGMGDTPDGGNYGSVFIDYDNDCDMDMFIAKCRGGQSFAKYNQLHRNNGDGTFTEVSVESNLWDPLQTWSSAWADYDNDGWMDVMVCASSDSDGMHKLMRNNGDGTFSDVTAGSGIDLQMGTSIENIHADFNNDGWEDVLGLGNVLMINNGDMTFSPNLGMTDYGPIGDLNNDGFIDIVSVGGFGNGNIRMNNGNDNNWLVVNTIGTISNKSGIGARVTLHSAMGQQIRDVRSGEGFRYMQSLNTHFGIGTDTQVDYITICWPSGIVDEIVNPDINGVLTVVEGSTVSVSETDAAAFSIYPNPARDIVQVKTNGQPVQEMRVYDLSGRMVMRQRTQTEQVDISRLAPGLYTLGVKMNGEFTHSRFTKE